MRLFGILGWVATGVLLAQTTPAPVKPAAAKPATAPAAAKPAAVKPPVPPLDPGLYSTITTSVGPVLLRLYEKESPLTVKNFMDLAQGRKEWKDPKTKARVKRSLYNGLVFHRVIPGFMIQGGDPEGTGMGGTDEIPDEFSPSLTFDRPGRMAMANAGPGTGSSQFFLTDVPTPHLNGRHTIFGQVVTGQEIVSKIANTPRDPGDRPRTPVRIVSVTFRRVGPGAQPGGPAPGVAKPKPARTAPAGAKPAAAKTPAAKPPAAKPPAAKPPAAKPPAAKPPAAKPPAATKPPAA
ncbi:MAG: peptidylprolyl isomerase [Bryobacteraceae bacterium]|nr:peptidylprolyl isomerase [Bryobacteraceae bacterium]